MIGALTLLIALATGLGVLNTALLSLAGLVIGGGRGAAPSELGGTCPHGIRPAGRMTGMTTG